MEQPKPGSENRESPSDFSEQAGGQSPGIMREFWDFLRENKKWWLLPIVIVLLLVGLLIVFGGGAFAPFIYTFF